MNRIDLKAGWDKLALFYPNIPQLSRERGEMIMDILGGFSADEFNTAIALWIENKKFYPSVAELKNYCFNARRKLESRRKLVELDTGGCCPYCGGSGFFGQMQAYRGDGVYEDVVYPCGCYASPKPEVGKRVLAQATEDTNWVFSKSLRAFVRRTEWIGDEDETPATREEINDVFRGAFRQIGGAV